jgi:hypothetical protein
VDPYLLQHAILTLTGQRPAFLGDREAVLRRLRDTPEFKAVKLEDLAKKTQQAQQRAQALALQRQQTETAIRELENVADEFASLSKPGAGQMQAFVADLKKSLPQLAEEAKKAQEQATEAQKKLDWEIETREAEELLERFWDKNRMNYLYDLFYNPSVDDPPSKMMERAAHWKDRPMVLKSKEELIEDARELLRTLKHIRTYPPERQNDAAAEAYYRFMQQTGQWSPSSDEVKSLHDLNFGVGPVFKALKGAEVLAKAEGKNFQVNWGGVGRTKEYDPLLNRTFDAESGERAPGMRGGGGWYTPEELQQIQENLSHKVSLNSLEEEALRRLQEAGPKAVRDPGEGGPPQNPAPRSFWTRSSPPPGHRRNLLETPSGRASSAQGSFAQRLLGSAFGSTVPGSAIGSTVPGSAIGQSVGGATSTAGGEQGRPDEANPALEAVNNLERELERARAFSGTAPDWSLEIETLRRALKNAPPNLLVRGPLGRLEPGFRALPHDPRPRSPFGTQTWSQMSLQK